MNVERLHELLSGAADGELTADERAELDTLLGSSPAARDEAARFRRLDDYLSRAPEVDPPPELTARILAGVQLPARRRDSLRGGWQRKLFTPPLLGYGLAAALGAFVAVALYETKPGIGDLPDISQLAGTLAPESVDRQAVLDRLEFETAGTSSIARLTRHNGDIVLDIRMDTDRPLQVDVDLGESAVSIAALTQAPDSPQSIRVTGRRLSIDSEGRYRVVALLRGEDQAIHDAELTLAYSSEGRTLKEGVLRINRH